MVSKMQTAKVATEFFGTFFLCLVISLTKTSELAPIGIGFTLMVSVYAGGHISGAHYNPAVTLALIVRGGCIEMVDAGLYVVSQFAGALAAGIISWGLLEEKDLAAYPAVGMRLEGTQTVSDGAALLAEFMLTFALASVVLHVATSKAQANNSYYGLAIGCTVLSGAVSVGRISGGCFNPAVGLLPFLYDPVKGSVWVYFVGPLAGGALAGASFRVVRASEYEESPLKALAPIAPLLIEAKGTMMLCFTIGCAAGAGGGGFLTPLSIGCILMAMIYMGGASSGAHYNPAVSICVLVRSLLKATHDTFSPVQAVKYVFAQVFGAVLGTFAAWGALQGAEYPGYPSLPKESNTGRGLLAEFFATFLLTYVILNVATSSALAGNSFFGLAIGQTVTAMAIAVGGISGGAFNPAVGLMGVVLKIGNSEAQAEDAWLYWVGPIAGGVASAAFFRFQNFEEFEQSKVYPKFMAHVGHGAHRQKFMSHSHHESHVTPTAKPAKTEEKAPEKTLENAA